MTKMTNFSVFQWFSVFLRKRLYYCGVLTRVLTRVWAVFSVGRALTGPYKRIKSNQGVIKSRKFMKIHEKVVKFWWFSVIFGDFRWLISHFGTRRCVTVVPHGPYRGTPPHYPGTTPPTHHCPAGHPVHHGSSQRFTRLLLVTTARAETRSS